MPERRDQTDVGTIERPDQRVKEPDLYRVILHNDDYTPMDIVVEILEQIFSKSPAAAHRIMMKVHIEGLGVAGVYTHEIAETKVEKVHEVARANGFPLRASLEEE